MPRKVRDPFTILGQNARLLRACIFLLRNFVHALGSAQQQQSTIKLMTYNIHAWRDSDHQCNFDRVIQVVNQAKPDILCLNEVLHPFATPSRTSSTPQQKSIAEEYYNSVEHGNGKNSLINKTFIPDKEKETFLHKLAKATKLENIDFLGATDNSFFGKGTSFGNAILSRYPIEDCIHVPLDVEDGDIKLGNQKRDFVDARAFSAAILDLGSDEKDDKQKRIGVVCTHLDHKSEELREQQVKRGIRKSEPFLEGIPHLICGDFNTFQGSDNDEKSWQKILNLYKDRGWPTPSERSLVIDALVNDFGYQDAFYESLKHESNDGSKSSQQILPQPTSWTANPLMRIDHVLLKNQPTELGTLAANTLVPIHYYRIDTDASDHFPVVLEFTA